MKNVNKEVANSYLCGQIDRRSFVKLMCRRGLALSGMGALLGEVSAKTLLENFDWKRHKGEWLKLLSVDHQYTTALEDNLDQFKSLTGINVSYETLSETNYFEAVNQNFDNKSPRYDVIMTGAYMTWLYGPQKKIVDHNEWIHDDTKTSPDYDWQDIIPSVRGSCAWSGVPGSALGSDDAKQWCIPWGYEQNSLSFNREILKSLNISVPENLDELIEAAARVQRDAPGTIGIGLRGSSSWATIHPGFFSAYSNFGERDLSVSTDGKLYASMNTRGSKEFHKKWVELVRSGASENWSNHSWYDILDEFKSGKSAMMYDADILGYAANSSLNIAATKIGYRSFSANPESTYATPNIWIWSLAISEFSEKKDAAWYFTQWATGKNHGLFGALKRDFVNPVRTSVWRNQDFTNRLHTHYPQYAASHEASLKGSGIKFTAQPLFFEITSQWAESLQKMVSGQYPVDEALEQLAERVNKQLQDNGIG